MGFLLFLQFMFEALKTKADERALSMTVGRQKLHRKTSFWLSTKGEIAPLATLWAVRATFLSPERVQNWL